MSWVTIIWSMIASVSFTLATIYLLIWLRERRSWAYLCFFVLALGVIGVAAGEFGAMYAKSPAEYGTAVRWGHFAYGFVLVGSLGFVHFYFGAGKWWLLGAALGLRVLAVVMNFSTGLNLHIRAIQSLQKVNFLGEPVSMLGEWTPNPWVRLGQIAALVQFVYVVDASLRLWRTGARESRRHALIVGGPLAFFILFSSAQAGLVAAGVLRMPIIVSFPFLAVLLAMGYELSRDVLRAKQLAGELRESEDRMTLASEAAGFGVWMWNIPHNEVWGSDRWLRLFGFGPDELATFEKVIQRIHPDDRERVEREVRRAVDGRTDYAGEYRVILPDGTQRWIVARGRMHSDTHGKPDRMMGAAIDITGRKQAELEIMQQRNELAHLSRVTTVSELSGSLAHELNQPLGIILSNAQAAQELLLQDPPVVTEVSEILGDIVAADRRASEIIHRLRALLKRGETSLQPLPLNDLIEEVLRLVRTDLIGRGVIVVCKLAPDLPLVMGDRVQLQQLALNLILNAADAMAANASSNRRIHITTTWHQHTVRVTVRDEGSGLPVNVEQLFQPFYTTKPHGLGMGLAICRSIINAHYGRLWAEPHPERGAVFHFELPVADSPQHS
jgi:two-component system, LuxR family, sensor kinase FixL